MFTITPEHTKEILAEMCKRVGIDSTTFDFTQENWYHQHSWTQDQENDFIEWLASYLRKKKLVIRGTKRGQDIAHHEASKIVSFYGWRLTDGEDR